MESTGGILPLENYPDRLYREFKGISLMQLSARSGVSMRRISLAERNRLTLREDERTRVSTALRELVQAQDVAALARLRAGNATP
jgi:transcriptional regulator with XRE-family HTH domain